MLRHGIGVYEAIILLLMVVLVFGSKRLPDTARSLGRSLRILKAETQGLRDDGQDPAEELLTSGPRYDAITGEALQRYDPHTGELLPRPVTPGQVASTQRSGLDLTL